MIAVPTSVGYGANFNGLSALLTMLNSCASGISVVNQHDHEHKQDDGHHPDHEHHHHRHEHDHHHVHHHSHDHHHRAYQDIVMLIEDAGLSEQVKETAPFPIDGQLMENSGFPM
ncbi:hypothetical protein AM1BK_40710 [Neobacillus kokaensis]|uniref:Uncharacterized protein n=1 Tax=Neobacillus kokaensis TaxID=2759023 RepID=A0ABQ3N8V6_9BACI|nr:hypothetical protein AM1BK_40710 [Neobacillus kokaensis]